MKYELLYISVREALCSQELGPYDSFGILVLAHGVCYSKVSDLSTDGRVVAALARRFTSEQLDPMQLYDIMEASFGI